MTHSKFPKMLDYEQLKHTFDNLESESSSDTTQQIQHDTDDQDSTTMSSNTPSGLTGTRLRSYAFAVLTRKEYSKKDLIDKLSQYALNKEEVITLVEELSRENYQSDQRVAEMVVRSQIRKGKGPNRIKLALRAKSIDNELAQNDMSEVDWYEEAYQLKVKKYGSEVSKDPKIKAKQIRFLQYRGFNMDTIMKAITRKTDD